MTIEDLSESEITPDGRLISKIAHAINVETLSLKRTLKRAGFFLAGVYVFSAGMSAGYELGSLSVQKTKEDAIVLAKSNLDEYSKKIFPAKLGSWEKYTVNKGFLMFSDKLEWKQ